MPSIAALADVLYREEIVRARAMPPEDKLLEGPRLFERACASFETVTGTARYLVTLRKSPFVCQFFVCGGDHRQAALGRRGNS